MKGLSAAAILDADDLARDVVDVPEWGGAVHVRELSLGERMKLAELAQGSPDTVACWLIAVAAVTSAGEPLFDPADVDATAEKLKRKQAAPINRISSAIMRLSGFGGDAEAADIEDAAGN